MADISMCSGDECTLKEKCWRYLAKANKYEQSYVEPLCTDGDCDLFWNVESKEK